MNEDLASHQRIGRLTPLADVLAAIGQIEPVAPYDIAVAAARGCILATDIVAKEPVPSKPVALRDGWAVDADSTRDAAAYAPLTLQPQPKRIDTFAALPQGTDAVAPLDAVTSLGGVMQITAPVAPGEGVLPIGGDIDARARLRSAGLPLRASDIAVLATAGVAIVTVRKPLVLVVNTRPDDPILGATAALVMRAITESGARTDISVDLDDALQSDGADAIISIGGTGLGRTDRSVIALSRSGMVTCHGIGISPGETSAFGMSKGRPVLLMPGRTDAALACWLLVGKPLIDRLAGARRHDMAMNATLTRKVTSAIGFAEVVPLVRNDDGVEPLAFGYLPLQSLTRANGWMLVPPESEGFPAGTEIAMRPLP
ncbi:MAG: molybdopterin-binding protein [Pseudomonadota bacterium]